VASVTWFPANGAGRQVILSLRTNLDPPAIQVLQEEDIQISGVLEHTLGMLIADARTRVEANR
jgi:hypothetical protein